MKRLRQRHLRHDAVHCHVSVRNRKVKCTSNKWMPEQNFQPSADPHGFRAMGSCLFICLCWQPFLIDNEACNHLVSNFVDMPLFLDSAEVPWSLLATQSSRSKYNVLADIMDPCSSLLDAMLIRRILTQSQYQSINNLDKPSIRCRQIIDYLNDKDGDSRVCEKVLEALEHTKQIHVVNVLKGGKTIERLAIYL